MMFNDIGMPSWQVDVCGEHHSTSSSICVRVIHISLNICRIVPLAHCSENIAMVLFIQLNSDHASYYRDALRYLGCIEIEDIPGILHDVNVPMYTTMNLFIH